MSEFPSKLVYLTGEYPKASHTFILREIAALRAQGMTVLTASIRKPSAENLIGPEEESEASKTFYVLEAAKRPLALLKAHAASLKQPRRWFGALGLALRTRRPGLKGLLWQLFYFLEAGVIAHHLQREGADHLHNHFADSSASVTMLASHMAGVPFSFTLHGPSDLFEPESWHLREKIARARHVFCISYFARSQAMLFSNPADWPKLDIVRCGVIPENYEGDGARGAGFNLLFVGRLAQVKGLRVLIEALETLRTTHPDMGLTLIGDGEDRAFTEEASKRLGNITLLGLQSQAAVAAEMKKAHALVLPSFAEGVPVVLMEAMSSGLPVIATRVAGVSELVEDGGSGLLVPPGSVTHLREAILKLAGDPELCRSMGEVGREKVRQDFNTATEAKHIHAILKGETSRVV